MATYYFSEYSDGRDTDRDEDGLDFDTEQAALSAAETALREFFIDGRPTKTSFALTVFDASFKPIRTVVLETRSVSTAIH